MELSGASEHVGGATEQGRAEQEADVPSHAYVMEPALFEPSGVAERAGATELVPDDASS